MTITIQFKSTPGEVQIQGIVLRLDIKDILSALTRSMTFIEQITSIPIESILIEEINDGE